jgi:HJR/Mrr/RecB family endonuclease
LTYSGKGSKDIFHVIIIMSVLILPNLSNTIRFTILLAMLAITLHQIQLTITSNHLEYKIKFFRFTLYRKTLTSEKIKKIKFARIGWSTKNAVVKVRGGFNFGVAHFYSEQLIGELEEFALANNIEIQKTRDYLLLEKYYSHN